MQRSVNTEKRSFGSVFSSGYEWTAGLACVLLALTWLVSNHYRPWVTFHSEFVALTGLGVLMASRLLAPGNSLAVPRIVLVILCIACTPWLQFVTGISLFAGDAVISSLYIIGLAGAVACGFQLAREDGAFFEGLAYALSIASLLSALVGLLQWLDLQEFLGSFAVQVDTGDRALGNVGQPNQLATLLLMGMASMALLFERRRFGGLAFAFGIFVMTWVLVLTQSRSGVLGVMTTALFLLFKARKSRLRLTATHIGVWVAFYMAALVAFPLINEALMLSGARASFGTTSDRLLIWSQVLDGIFQAPWFGYGWNQTPTAHLIGALHHPGDITYIYAHNVVLDLLAWLGIPLGVLLTVCGICWFCSRMAKTNRGDAVYAMAALLPFAIHSLLEFPFAYAYFLVWAGLLAGVVEASMPNARVFAARRRLVASVLVTCSVLGVCLSYEYLSIEEDFRIVRFENMRVGVTEQSYQIPEIRISSHMGAMLRAARQRATPGMDTQAVEELRLVAMRFPWGALTFRYAMALGLNGDPEGASRIMQIIYGMYGARYYRVVREELEDMKARYPQLSAVRAPEAF